eukprot:767781-Hanusia_phi.AAC.3
MSFFFAGNYSFNGDEDDRVRSGAAYVSQDLIQPNSCYKDAQDHVPLAYGIVKNFLTDGEVQQIKDWFIKGSVPEIRRTTFDGEDLESNQGYSESEPTVCQLYGQPDPFKKEFPTIFSRILAQKDSFGKLIGLGQEELDHVNFAQDIRYVTYRKGNSCPWHRDDPTSHFNTIMMITEPGKDFDGGVLEFHPTSDPTAISLQSGDAVIYSTPKVDHSVSEVTDGVRSICLVELKLERLANRHN